MQKFNRHKRNLHTKVGCFLCGESHMFERCPQLPKGIRHAERRELLLASRDRNEERKNTLLARVFDRLEQENAAKNPPAPSPGTKAGQQTNSWYAIPTLFPGAEAIGSLGTAFEASHP